MFGWLVAPICALLVLAGTYSFGYMHGKATVQTDWDSANAQALEEQRDKEAELQSNMDKLRTEKNRELARLNTTVQRLSDSLRSRPDRPLSGAAASARPDSEGCTGAVVYRQDGEFLIGEATRADQLRIALKTCQSAYESAYGKQPE